MANSQVVHSEGIFHGLPTYPDASGYTNLTAVVTGANGITGYAMVKVLAAAPKRWAKIYCLSRRPPPDYFFSSLGDGAKRVEHVAVDFLSDPNDIAKVLKGKVDKVDHVFFFSYLQPKQEGKPLSMWSNADELAEVNSRLLNNFLTALRKSSLQPKRFMLQTGAKNYAFHIGPATNPSFESDPRVNIETNFYYPQEDSLFEYCRDQNVGWNVVRPSYIIGAAQDSALNHLVGFSIYAAVQAHLKKPMNFPGDYTAWDREHCQSSAMLNSYMEEWTVLNPDAANQAFNMTDCQPFTYGRLWPYLANWYGTSWNPPEPDDSKYKSSVSRYEVTPRGYGPRGVTRFTFNFLDWSEDPEVVKAWGELKQKHGLSLDPFASRDVIFGQVNSCVIGGWPLSMSMHKARKLGWHGFANSYESAFHSLQEMAGMKVIVPMVKSEWTEAL
ncbi:hypothetical protein NA57DRAFT_61983 [Rhizodiscina lignyota]|uniref:PRISE-like Rossmann-fold domain-containing protein n=1 Tax=Rhizodiscina lignyota TaxID=1504668 RepID=A0A9P4M329_9PEZI|nr:hypothetical protein NA57DRAFT_61983 [Rhizodiscina lignyota]